jgi:hypothetical protein
MQQHRTPVVFISHADVDKPFIERYALAIAKEIGEDYVFYDAWANQPGDSVVGNVDDALGRATHFFLFMTRASMQRPWVKHEWHSALVKRLASEVRLIPVRIDDVEPPPLLAALKYIDAAFNGPDIAEEEILRAVRGERVFRPSPEIPNLTARVNGGTVTFSVAKYPLPGAHLAILMDDPNADIAGVPMEAFEGGPSHYPYTTPEGKPGRIVVVRPFRVITPGQPFTVMVGPGNVVGCLLRTGSTPDPIPIVST